MGDGGLSQQRRVPKELKPQVKRAQELGWTSKDGRGGGFFMFSPGKTARFYIPATAKDPFVLARKFSVLISKTFVSENPGLVDGGDAIDFVVEALAQGDAHVNLGPSPTIECSLCGDEFIDYDGYAKHLDEKHPTPHEEDTEGEAVPETPALDAQENTASAKMHDMEEAMERTTRPYRVVAERRSDGTVLTRASSAVLEVLVNGVPTGTYLCAVEGCPWENTNPKSVASHHVMHVAKGEAPPPVDADPRVESADKYPQVITRRTWIIPADEVEKVVYAVMRKYRKRKTDTDSTYARIVAQGLAEAGYTLRKVGDEEPVEVEVQKVEPSQAEEILTKVRELVGTDPDMKAALAVAQAQVEAVEGELATAKAELEARTGFIRTLASLAQQEGQ